MDIIRELVQSIVVIVILAVFLEMLLPASAMRSYLRLIFGILVMIVVLQAVFSLVNRENLALDMPTMILPWEETPELSGQLQDILDEGGELYDHGQQKALEEYKNGLAKQISGLAGLNGNVKVTEVQVSVEEDRENPYYGYLTEIFIEIDAGNFQGASESGGEIDPIDIQVSKQDDYNGGQEISEEFLGSEAVGKIKNNIADFYSLPSENINIFLRE